MPSDRSTTMRFASVMVARGNEGQMSSAHFKPGDTVRLKSGGPAMTVNAVEGDWVSCAWFDGSKKHEDTFPAAGLEPDNSAFEAQRPRW
jgi:uncharacterized protein YodC (DUF2158 family)